LPLTHVGDDVLDGEHGWAINPWFIRFRRLMVAFQNNRYVGYGHLDVSIIDVRDKDVWPVAVVLQIIIKGSDQTFICGGGDWFEQPLQTLALKLLNCPLCCIILGEIFFDGKCGLQDELSTLKRGLGYHGLGPTGPRSQTLPSKHAGTSLGNFVEHVVGTSKNKGLKTLL
jgi:hypothetical protein